MGKPRSDRVSHRERHYRVKPDADHPPRACRLCGDIHHRKHAWCASCWGTWSAERERPRAPGSPPPAPPGFRASDLQTGKPRY